MGNSKKEAYFNERERWPIVREENGRGTMEGKILPRKFGSQICSLEADS